MQPEAKNKAIREGGIKGMLCFSFFMTAKDQPKAASLDLDSASSPQPRTSSKRGEQQLLFLNATKTSRNEPTTPKHEAFQLGFISGLRGQLAGLG
ncbi:hypothetical protein Nepgr_012411 [Nepenthes gracilis]|uniref:Uncharacterized protein n=1 Tax=Nepenthes gracilis TaxID=150966 RepID=A0AAD3SGV9_NEPGR|nr:hypothetical protein Nepgr_012411 [Nepenthes gracilis]